MPHTQECCASLAFKSLTNSDVMRCFPCSDLSKACSSNERQSDIPDCFIKFKHQFLMYGEYCSNLPTAQARVDELFKKNPDISQAIQVSKANTFLTLYSSNSDMFLIRTCVPVKNSKGVVLMIGVCFFRIVRCARKKVDSNSAIY